MNLEAELAAQYASASQVDMDSELRIRDAAELFAALESNDMVTRLSVLEALVEDPTGALALGGTNGRDLIDVLRSELQCTLASEMRLTLIAALSAMPDDVRVTQSLEQIWFLSDDTNERLSVITRLSHTADPSIKAHLEQSLLGIDSDRAQMIANVWSASELDSSAIRLRLNLAAQQPSGAVPSLDTETGLWLKELGGTFSQQCRETLELDTSSTVRQLAARWEQLDHESRAWLLELAKQHESPELQAITRLAMEDKELQLEAIRASATMTGQFTAQLEQFANHPDPQMQAAAITAGASGDNRSRALRSYARTVRIAAIRQLGDDDQATLIQLLHDQDWRIRSASADRLSQFGARAKEAVKPLLEHDQLEIRMAASRIYASEFDLTMTHSA